ncbi:alpha-amylase family glycosyl hydrolase [Rhabdobacter roseus]|uniref:Alpha-amylase n=1 Tax=Rhabdobacter roseus TaxID=1655419 RepID=A0A840U0M4_9BACT|nr:alpha-amylase family glycosyl hydrolase [Rhabdobacter roseus]MBB5285928.1 glycosidase [Rhabdobacter roseus]
MTPLPKVCYEIFVRSFCDSNGDRIGDLNGITSRLDYLRELGIEALWLTPVHPSPSYHKYDVLDYYAIDPEYGTLDDFKRLLREAHQRGIQVYLDLIINHTSVLHPWFEEARQSAQSPYRSYYWWMNQEQIDRLGVAVRSQTADSREVYPWHDNADDPEKYYGLFFKGMPDLNYDSANLRTEIRQIMDFWLNEMGVDGFRLDAARHIYPEWLKEKNHAFWEEFGQVVESTRKGTYTVGEVWAPAQEVAPYFKGLKAAFHFDLSFEIQLLLLRGRDKGLVEKLLTDYTIFEEHNRDFIDATMLTNHDQNRIGSVVGGDIRKMKLAAALLLTLPGQPYLYYGEEIGMLGMKPDPRIREPFLWTDERDDPQRPLWIKPRHSRRANVRALALQQPDPDSLFNHYKRLIALRKSHPALGQIIRPNLAAFPLDDTEWLAYYRPHDEQSAWVLHNLSGQTKYLAHEQIGLEKHQLLFATYPTTLLRDAPLEVPPYGSVVLGYAPPAE